MNSLLTIAFFTLTVAISNSPASTNHLYYPKTEERDFDTIPKFIVDDYPLTFDMIYQNRRSRKSGDVESFEGAWFSNDTLNQTLVFELYTDGHRLYTFHFLNNDIPPGLIDRMELHPNIDIASNELKQKHFKGFLTQTTKIGKSYFKTDKGFKLGDSKEKALRVYGKPATSKTVNGIERCEWEFVGDITYEYEKDKPHLNGKPLAEDSHGHQVTMFFRKNKMIGLILHNDIP